MRTPILLLPFLLLLQLNLIFYCSGNFFICSMFYSNSRLNLDLRSVLKFFLTCGKKKIVNFILHICSRSLVLLE